MADDYYYPPVGFYFTVAFRAAPALDHRFQEVSGITVEYQTMSYAEGGETRFIHQLPTRTTYSPLVLKRGYVPKDSELGRWCKTTFEGLDNIITPKDLFVSLLDENGRMLQMWTFKNAWPKKWSISSFNAMSNSLVVETITFNYQYFTLSKS